MQTHPTPLNASSSSLLSQVERESLANVAEVAETKANERSIPLSLSQDLSTAETGDKKLETRATCSGLDPTELPKSVQKQLNSSKAIKYFYHLESLIKDLKRKRTDIIMTAIYQNAPTYDLKKIRALQKIAKGFIQSFAGKFNFIVEPDRLERLKAIFQFFPSNSRVQFESVSVIILGFEHIASVAQWFSKEKTVVYLMDHKVEELPDLIGGLKDFTTLHISGCGSLKSIQNIGLCKNLKYLQGSYLNHLESLRGIERCKELEEVVLNRCPGLKDITALTKCSKLKKIDLTGGEALEDVNSLGQCKELEAIDLSGCTALKDISGLARCSKLKKIILRGYRALKELNILGNCAELEEVFLRGCPGLKDVTALAGCSKLKKIFLSDCNALEDLKGLGKCQELEKLTLYGCTALTDISGLAGSLKLRKITLRRCGALEDLRGLGECKELEELNLSDCTALTDISALAGSLKLRKITLRRCGVLEDLRDLGECKELEELNLSDCTALKDISALAGCSELKKIQLPSGRTDLKHQLPEYLQACVKLC